MLHTQKDIELFAHRKTECAKVVQVIETETVIGTGEAGDPVRSIKEYWNFDGERLGVIDPLTL